MEVGRLRALGLARESIIGTLVTPPTEFIRFIPPDSFYPKISPLVSKGIGVLPDVNIKQTQGPATLDGMKFKIEVEAENIGHILDALLGLDTVAEVASFVVGASNNAIDFKEDGGSQLHATIASLTYPIGTSSAQAGTLCAAVKTALQAVGTGTYTISYSYTTKKMTIAAGGSVTNIQILWLTGTNNATSAYSVLGFTKVDTSSATTVVSNSTTTVAPFSHTFVRQAVSQLPTYSFWLDKKPAYFEIGGCMLGKVDIDMKAKELIMMDTEWHGITFDDTGTTQSPVFSPVRPFAFHQATVQVDGAPVLGFDSLKVSINNMVKADHALSGSKYPTKIYTEGMEVDLSADLFFEDVVQYNKFVAGTTAAFVITLTSGDDISGAAAGQKYSLTLNLPVVVYKQANLPTPSGVLKVTFAGHVMYDTVTSKTINAVLKNSITTTYSA